MAELVCALSSCNRVLPLGSTEVLCHLHLAMIEREPPVRLDKKTENLDEAAVARSVERDAWPLFLIALSWCARRAIEADQT